MFRTADGPGSLLGQTVGLLNDRQPIGTGGGGIQRPMMIGVEPGGVGNQRITSPALCQLAPQVTQFRAKVLEFLLPTSTRILQPPPAQQPFGLDCGDRPPAQFAKLSRDRNGFGIRVAGFTSQAPSRNPDGDRMAPEPAEQFRDRTGRDRSRPPAP